MEIVCISDTHGQHSGLVLPAGDLLIHAGDLSPRGDLYDVKRFLAWFAGLDFEHKVFIGGNHDFYLEEEPEKFRELVPEGCTYLNDSGISIEGKRIWGSPIQPWFHNWAFNRNRGPEIRKHWDLIPEDTDILITHGPPFGQLDLTVRKEAVGCEDLRAVVDRIQPELHVFGHIHEDYGVKQGGKTIFANASVLNVRYELVNDPLLFHLD